VRCSADAGSVLFLERFWNSRRDGCGFCFFGIEAF
jgi:hypothetical protein